MHLSFQHAGWRAHRCSRARPRGYDMRWIVSGAICLFVTTVAADPVRVHTCAVVGDSIAEAVQSYLPCQHNTKIGISSAAIAGRLIPGVAVTVISAGSNDPLNPFLRLNLRIIHSRAHSRVVWILPINAIARAAVETVAAEYDEPVLSFEPAGDHVHPRDNRALAETILENLK